MGQTRILSPKGPTGQDCVPATSQKVRVGWSLLWGRRNVSSVTASPLSHCPLGTSGPSPPSHRKLSPSWRQKEGTLKEVLQDSGDSARPLKSQRELIKLSCDKGASGMEIVYREILGDFLEKMCGTLKEKNTGSRTAS